ncbi:MAG: hypothetical protein Q7S01_00300 [bacterium]|nr:hypothetical protein [bacterium]
MRAFQAKRMKDEIRRLMRLTRPPRMEGVVKEAMMQPVRKPKMSREEPQRPRKTQVSTEQRKEYHLADRRQK